MARVRSLKDGFEPKYFRDIEANKFKFGRDSVARENDIQSSCRRPVRSSTEDDGRSPITFRDDEIPFYHVRQGT